MMQRTLIKEGGILDYDPDFLSRAEADHLMISLQEEVQWEQKHYTNYRTGEKFPQPRLTAWYADDPSMQYSYSGVTQKVQYWIPELLELKSRLERVTQAQYNSVLLNLYRDGSDSVGSHADDEKELGTNATIASVSLGATRSFRLGCYKRNPSFDNRQEGVDSRSDLEFELTHGSLIVMSGTTQHYWKHEIPKQIRTAGQIKMGVPPIGPRINLTYRWFYNLK